MGAVAMLILNVLGGLALFIYGMAIMGDGLRLIAGRGLHAALARATRRRLYGLALGTGLGFLVHSSATTVMVVGFVNAGLLPLAAAVPPILGANIGSTLSMQVISFHFDRYCYAVIAAGLLARLLARQDRVRAAGDALLGFGLLFLGMRTMGDAVRPYGPVLSPWLARVDATSWTGRLLGAAGAALFTAVVQSSGATIGICFAMISAGIFTSLAQVLPIVLGAHVGTCVTALLGSIGTGIQARRAAVAHLLFNVLNAALALAAAPWLVRWLSLSSPDVVRQTANLHTTVMLLAAMLVLPAAGPFARLVARVLPSRRPDPEPSRLDRTVLDRPELAIVTAVRELNRVTRLCAESLHWAAESVFTDFAAHRAKVKVNERAVNQIKRAMRDYLEAVAHRRLSERQAMLVAHLDRCMTDIERIGDHIDALCDTRLAQLRAGDPPFTPELKDRLFALHEAATRIMRLVRGSLDPDRPAFQEQAREILQARDAYAMLSIEARATLVERVSAGALAPLAGIYYGRYVAAYDRIVRHAKSIALAEQQPQFWLKRQKLDLVAAEAPRFRPPERPAGQDFLDRLQREEYL